MKAHNKKNIEISTFLIPNIHGPFLISAELVDGFDHTARVSSSGVLLYCTQEALKRGTTVQLVYLFFTYKED